MSTQFSQPPKPLDFGEYQMSAHRTQHLQSLQGSMTELVAIIDPQDSDPEERARTVKNLTDEEESSYSRSQTGGYVCEIPGCGFTVETDDDSSKKCFQEHQAAHQQRISRCLHCGEGFPLFVLYDAHHKERHPSEEMNLEVTGVVIRGH